MPWIELHQSVKSNKKTYHLAELLDIGRPQAVGHLCFLWTWAIDNAQDGDLSDCPMSLIANESGWVGDPKEFLTALKSAGFVDTDTHIHDWDDYAGKLIDRRVRNKEAMRVARVKHVDNTCITQEQHESSLCKATVPTVPNHTVPTNQNASLEIDGVVTHSHQGGDSQSPHEQDTLELDTTELNTIKISRFQEFWDNWKTNKAVRGHKGNSEQLWVKIQHLHPSVRPSEQTLIDCARRYCAMRIANDQQTKAVEVFLNPKVREWEAWGEDAMSAPATLAPEPEPEYQRETIEQTMARIDAEDAARRAEDRLHWIAPPKAPEVAK